MKPSIPFPMVLLLALLILLTATGASAAGGYLLAGSVVAGGGGTLQQGEYALTGTLGQAEAAHVYQGGVYQVTGGFWHSGTPSPETGCRIYLPLTLR